MTLARRRQPSETAVATAMPAGFPSRLSTAGKKEKEKDKDAAPTATATDSHNTHSSHNTTTHVDASPSTRPAASVGTPGSSSPLLKYKVTNSRKSTGGAAKKRSASGTGTHPVPATTVLLPKEKSTAGDKAATAAVARRSVPVLRTASGNGTGAHDLPPPPPPPMPANGAGSLSMRSNGTGATTTGGDGGKSVRIDANAQAAPDDHQAELVKRVKRYRYSEGQASAPTSPPDHRTLVRERQASSQAHRRPRSAHSASHAHLRSGSAQHRIPDAWSVAPGSDGPMLANNGPPPRPSVQSSGGIGSGAAAARGSLPRSDTPSRQSSMFASRSPGPGLGHFQRSDTLTDVRSEPHSPPSRFVSVSADAYGRMDMSFGSPPSYAHGSPSTGSGVISAPPRKKPQPNLRGIGLGQLIRSSDAHLRATKSLQSKGKATNTAFSRSSTYNSGPTAATPPLRPAPRPPTPEKPASPATTPAQPVPASNRPHVPTLSLIGKGLRASKSSAFSRSRTTYGLGRY